MDQDKHEGTDSQAGRGEARWGGEGGDRGSAHGSGAGYGARDDDPRRHGSLGYTGPGRDATGGGGRGAPRRPVYPRGYVRSDARIHEDVCETLSRSGLDVSEVSVTVQDGHVTLDGTVPERRMKHRIEDIADACGGVKDVTNHIRVARAGDAGRGGWASSAVGGERGADVGGMAGGSPTGSGLGSPAGRERAPDAGGEAGSGGQT